jgi:formamidopyrimidine-DNA glycosylase
MEMDSPPHPVLHFGSSPCFTYVGMTGWIRVKGCATHYYSSKDEEQWPPRFVKFIIRIADTTSKPKLDKSLIPDIWGTEIAFVDARRLGRIRLVDAKDPFSVPYVDAYETDVGH